MANQKKKSHAWIWIILILVAGGFAAWKYMPRQAETDTPAYSEYTVSSGTVSVTVSGSGVLSAPDEFDVTLPAGLEILSVEAEEGETVQADTVLYTLDPDSVEEALTAAREELENCEYALARVSSSDALRAQASGRVKIIYAGVGDSVEDVMRQYGCLAILSGDGKMAAALTSEAELTVGSKPEVSFTVNGIKHREEGTVLSREGNLYTVTFKDNDALPGTEVSFSWKGQVLGTGTAFIHSPLPVTGTKGTVKSVDVKVNGSVTAYSKMFTLTGSIYDTSYDTALRQKEKAVETYNTLIAYRLNPVVLAGEEGLLASLDLKEGDKTPAEDTVAAVLHTGGATEMRVDIDESDILQVTAGQSAAISLDAVSGESFPATVSRIDKRGVETGSITTYTVTLRLENDARLMESMHGNAVITTAVKENVITVPVAVLNEDDAGTYVLVKEEGTPVIRYVTAGISDGIEAEITAGLSEGEVILYSEQGGTDIVSLMMERRDEMMSSMNGAK